MAIDTNSMFSSYLTTQTGNALSSSKTSSLEGTLGKLSSDTDDETLMEACKGFETYLVEQVYKEMEKSVKEEEEENEYLSCFGDTLIEEYAKATTESGSLGLAQKLFESIKSNS
mgnify:CR=1 FL=1